MKIALIQLNYTVGNIESNIAKIKHGVKEAKAKGADLAVFAELAVCGYPPKDLLLQNGFVQRCNDAISTIAKECKGIAAIVGGPSHNYANKGRPVFNSAYFLAEGKIKQIVNKTLLPFYDIFDEYRYFEPGTDNKLIKYKGTAFALTICEDIWNIKQSESGSDIGDEVRYNHLRFPLKELKATKADCVINISASPFSYTQKDERMNVALAVVKDFKIPILYVNNIGTNTDLTFDGGSFVLDKKGGLVGELAYFKEDMGIFELDGKKVKGNLRISNNEYRITKGKTGEYRISNKEYRMSNGKRVWYCSNKIEDESSITESVYNSLVIGIHDYFNKSGIKKAVLGVSGGIDSALVLVLAIEALGKENVKAIVLPSVITSDETMTDAMQLLKNTGCKYENISIETGVKAINESLSESFKGLKPDITEENIQARMRGLLIMAITNKTGALMLNTSNKSELATGYGTLYGDMGGALSVLGDVYKTQIYRLAEYINEKTGQPLIPKNILTKAPTAELKPNQKDTDTLPEFEILDKILVQYIEMHKSADEIKAKGADQNLVEKIIKMVNKAEFKRNQFAPILRISPKSFGVGRRMPVVGKL